MGIPALSHQRPDAVPITQIINIMSWLWSGSEVTHVALQRGSWHRGTGTLAQQRARRPRWRWRCRVDAGPPGAPAGALRGRASICGSLRSLASRAYEQTAGRPRIWTRASISGRATPPGKRPRSAAPARHGGSPFAPPSQVHTVPEASSAVALRTKLSIRRAEGPAFQGNNF